MTTFVLTFVMAFVCSANVTRYVTGADNSSFNLWLGIFAGFVFFMLLVAGVMEDIKP